MTEVRRDPVYFSRINNCLWLALASVALFLGIESLSLLQDSMLLKWLAGALLIVATFFALMTLGGPYQCARCGGRLEPRQYAERVRYYCRHCDVEWVTDLLSRNVK